MENVINLVKMQFRNLLAIKRTMLLILALAIIMTIINPIFISFSGALIIMAVCYNPAFYEEKSKNIYLIGSLPIKRESFILAKFIYSAIVTVFAIIFTVAEYFVLNYLKVIQEFSLKSIIFTVFIVGIFVMTILIPVSLILGFDKGRYILIFLSVVPMCFSENIASFISNLGLKGNKTLICLMGILILAVLILTSYFVTSNLYKNKEAR